MTRHRLVVVLAAATVALGVAAAVHASIPDGAGTIHGCYTKTAPPGGQPGELRVIDTALGQTCQLSESAVNWSQTGPPGPQGPQGPQGPPGPKGDKGDPGANAYFAGTGLQLSGGNTFNIQKSYQLPQGCGLNQAPYQTAVPNTWGCFTAANAGENCSSGKFQNGVDANGDIKCATPATGPAGPDLWLANGTPNQDLPQGSETTLVTLSLPAGTFLLSGDGTVRDDAGGNDNVDYDCTFTAGSGTVVAVDIDAASAPFALHDVATLAGPANVSLQCFDIAGSDHAYQSTLSALKIGTLH